MTTQRLAMNAAAGTMILAFALTGCSNGESGESQGPETEGQRPETAEANSEAEGDSGAGATKAADATKPTSSGLSEDADLSKEAPSVTAKDAIATAKKEAKDGTVHAIELDFDKREKAWRYEVKILQGTTDFDIEVNAESGQVVDVEKDTTNDKEKAIDLNKPMTHDEALKLAQGKASGRLDGWKLESDDGRTEYQFDFDDKGQELEVSVDVESKRVTVDD